MNILLVEDDKDIAQVVRNTLLANGCAVSWATSGTEGWQDFQAGSYDLLIVDIMLPEMDGFTLCKHIRLISQVPLLILSAKIEVEDKVRGLQLGADDYLTKPFSLQELLARVQSLFRRFTHFRQENSESMQWTFCGGLRFLPKFRKVFRNEQEISLTSKEFELLHLLVSHPHRVFSKQELYEHVWQQEYLEDNNTVAMHIKSLRGKLEDSSKKPMFIQTIWGTGYCFIGEPLE